MPTRIPGEIKAETPTAPDRPDADSVALARMLRVNPDADSATHLPGVPPSRVPRHIAFIMDGNGRWAQQRGLPRAAGHQAGARAAKAIVEEAGRCGVEVITLYSFSSENWKRPRDEVDALMALYLHGLREERDALRRNNIRFVHIGRREGLPAGVLDELDATIEATRSCTGCTLCLAINYGSRAEITDAVREIAGDVRRGALAPHDIDEATISDRLHTRGLPDPDLLVRTAGESRVSNYLLWQISYAEIHVTETLWPDFGASSLHAAIRDYASRTRRFGGLDLR